MKSLHYHIKTICDRNKDGSFGTLHARSRALFLAADQLHALGYKVKAPRNLKPKHIHILSQYWMSSGIASGTIKNRMSHLRWLSQKINNPSLVRSTNEYYGIPHREFISKNRAVDFDANRLNAITDPHVRLAAELQKQFGLRREEAMKFQPSFANRGTHIQIKPSWSKGGRGRAIPIANDAQREVLRRAQLLAGSGSLIPLHRSYKQHMWVFEKQMHRIGLGNTHGARHHYAQQRYIELSGNLPVAQGGKKRRYLSPVEKLNDTQARKILAAELGHNRVQIVSVYLGG